MIKNKKEGSFYDTYKSLRRDWGGINPVTKVIENKKRKKARKEKHRLRYMENEEF
jgi:hypothetical protein